MFVWKLLVKLCTDQPNVIDAIENSSEIVRGHDRKQPLRSNDSNETKNFVKEHRNWTWNYRRGTRAAYIWASTEKLVLAITTTSCLIIRTLWNPFLLPSVRKHRCSLSNCRYVATFVPLRVFASNYSFTRTFFYDYRTRKFRSFVINSVQSSGSLIRRVLECENTRNPENCNSRRAMEKKTLSREESPSENFNEHYCSTKCFHWNFTISTSPPCVNFHNTAPY